MYIKYNHNPAGIQVGDCVMDDGGDVFDYLEDAMSHARSEQEREAIRQAMMKLDK